MAPSGNRRKHRRNRARAPGQQSIWLSLSSLLLLTTPTASASIEWPRNAVYLSPRAAVAELLVERSAASSSLSTTQYTPNEASLFTILPNGSISSTTALTSTSAGGSINAICYYTPTNTLFVGGQFTSMSSTPTLNFAAINLTSGTVGSLNVMGTSVDTLYCDEVNQRIWIGGDISAPTSSSSAATYTNQTSSYESGVLLYYPSNSSFTPPPFGGLSGGLVEAITPSTNNASLYFTGSFEVTYTSTTTTTTSTYNGTGATITAGSSPFSAALSPLTITTPTTNILGYPSSQSTGFDDPSVLLCPHGADGTGSTWLAGEGSQAKLDLYLGAGVTASGIRVGNTYVTGSSTTSFSLTSLPDSTLLTLTYVDPTTNITQSCSSSCPLLASNAALQSQDFLFAGGGRELTGVEMQLLSWTGTTPGLHSLELLSTGASASAVAVNNTCTAQFATSSKSSSTSSTNGTWTTKTYASATLPGTEIPILSSFTPAASFPPSVIPSVSMYPTISSQGTYEVYLSIPGCTAVGDCATRSNVFVEVFATSSQVASSRTISEQVTADTSVLIWNGTVAATTSSFSPYVTVSLPTSNAQLSTDSTGYGIVASTVEFTLMSVNSTNTNTTSTSSPTFGVFEWATSSSASENATVAISNSSETTVDKIGGLLATALNTTTNGLEGARVNGIVESSTGDFYVGGEFSTSTFSNIVKATSAGGAQSLAALSEGGLNGAVQTIAILDNTIYVGGNFTGTSTSSSTALNYVAKYNLTSNSWSPLAGGVDGPVEKLLISGGNVLIAGNFASYSTSSGMKKRASSSTSSGGFVVYNPSTSSFNTPAFTITGTISALALSASSGGAYIAGQISAIQTVLPVPSSTPNSVKHVLAVGIVVLISLAIATGFIFFLVLVGFIWSCLRGNARDDRPFPAYAMREKDPKQVDSDQGHDLMPPSTLLEHLNAATAAALFAGSAAGAGTVPGQPQPQEKQHEEPDSSDEFHSAEGVYGPGRLAQVRYSWIPEGDAELGLKAGKAVLVLDDTHDEWWFAEDPTTGERGAVPASYLF